jgi:two-component system cell cycle response regulator
VKTIDKRVLLVEDSSFYQRLISVHLRDWGFDVVVAKDGLQAWTIFQQPDSPSLALMDWVMPKMDGLEVCKKLRERPSEETYVYTILLTGKDGKGDLLKAMEAGADDYLVKPFDELELKARLMVGRRILDLHGELISAREAMRHAATHDSLTGLLNRKETLEALQLELSRAKRDKSPVTVMLVDLDHFKAVNDENGHLFGDEMLRELGRRFRAGVRDYDSVGRYGGEEFLFVLPGCDLTRAFIRADQIRKSVSSTPVSRNGTERCATVSIGLAVSQGLGEGEAESLLQQADMGLYEAKRKGRDRVDYMDTAAIKVQHALAAP